MLKKSLQCLAALLWGILQDLTISHNHQNDKCSAMVSNTLKPYSYMMLYEHGSCDNVTTICHEKNAIAFPTSSGTSWQFHKIPPDGFISLEFVKHFFKRKSNVKPGAFCLLASCLKAWFSSKMLIRPPGNCRSSKLSPAASQYGQLPGGKLPGAWLARGSGSAMATGTLHLQVWGTDEISDFASKNLRLLTRFDNCDYTESWPDISFIVNRLLIWLHQFEGYTSGATFRNPKGTVEGGDVLGTRN